MPSNIGNTSEMRFIEPKHRKQPFRQKIIKDAERDNVGLLSTVELYNAILAEAEKPKRITKKEIRDHVKKPGLIEFSI